ncbi:hypothetical protein [Undibacterium sp. Xuan67W]|uniref:hypothetical protein n=1 Tax=Undibacterium sp. Xuan67W TaxID=3413057 RepID=UPI003BF0D10C
MKSKFFPIICSRIFLVFAVMASSMTYAVVPSITVTRSPANLVAGNPYTVYWTVTDTVSLVYQCAASGTGFRGTGYPVVTSPNSSYSSSGVASADWVNYPTACIWTATSADGKTASVYDNFYTVPKAPTIKVTRSPAQLSAGGAYSVTWATTDAKSVSYKCTASGTGYSGAQTLDSVNNTVYGTADPNWVKYPSTCVWTAIGDGGQASLSETLVTTRDPSAVGEIVGRDLNAPGVGFLGHVGLWTGGSVAEVMNELTVVQFNSLQSFKSKTTFWGTAGLNVQSYNVEACYQPYCSNYLPTSQGGQRESVNVRVALVKRALQIQQLGASYTISPNYSEAAEGSVSTPARRGLYRCDTFLIDLFTHTVPYGNSYMTKLPYDQAWSTKVSNLWGLTIQPRSLFNSFN